MLIKTETLVVTERVIMVWMLMLFYVTKLFVDVTKLFVDVTKLFVDVTKLFVDVTKLRCPESAGQYFYICNVGFAARLNLLICCETECLVCCETECLDVFLGQFAWIKTAAVCEVLYSYLTRSRC